MCNLLNFWFDFNSTNDSHIHSPRYCLISILTNRFIHKSLFCKIYPFHFNFYFFPQTHTHAYVDALRDKHFHFSCSFLFLFFHGLKIQTILLRRWNCLCDSFFLSFFVWKHFNRLWKIFFPACCNSSCLFFFSSTHFFSCCNARKVVMKEEFSLITTNPLLIHGVCMHSGCQISILYGKKGKKRVLEGGREKKRRRRKLLLIKIMDMLTSCCFIDDGGRIIFCLMGKLLLREWDDETLNYLEKHKHARCMKELGVFLIDK